jgi:hypothetical protein
MIPRTAVYRARVICAAFDAHDSERALLGSLRLVLRVPRNGDALSAAHNARRVSSQKTNHRLTQISFKLLCNCRLLYGLSFLDMPLSGVYIAALPGKKAAGVCRTKRGNYGRAVIETN